jgi:hypothetical protein
MRKDQPTASPTPREKHSRSIGASRAFWWTDRLWRHARDLEPVWVAIDDIAEFDMDCWFGPTKPATCRAVAEHARRIQAADLRFPIILSADGGLMDGGHRIAKAWLAQKTEIRAVRFLEDPEPDWVE